MVCWKMLCNGIARVDCMEQFVPEGWIGYMGSGCLEANSGEEIGRESWIQDFMSWCMYSAFVKDV